MMVRHKYAAAALFRSCRVASFVAAAGTSPFAGYDAGAARAQTPPEPKAEYQVSVAVPPTDDTSGSRVSRHVWGIADDGTIFFLNNRGGSTYPTLQKRRPNGEVVQVVAPLDKLPDGATCLEIKTVVVGANGDLVLWLHVSGLAPAPPIGPLQHPLRVTSVPNANNPAPPRDGLYFLPREVAGKPSALADAARIAALDDPAPGGGWFHDWKAHAQIADDGTVVIGAVVAAPPARFDAYYVYRPAAANRPKGTLSGPIVSSVQKSPVYAGSGGTEFFTLGAPAFDAAGNLIFAAEPAAKAVPFAPDFALYRLSRSIWEAAVATADTPALPLPAPARLLGVKDLPDLASDTWIEGNRYAPLLNSAGNSIVVVAQVRGEPTPRLYETRLDPSGSVTATRLIAGGAAASPDGTPWRSLDAEIVRGPDGQVFLSGIPGRGQHDSDSVWSLRPDGGYALVVDPKMRLNGEAIHLTGIGGWRAVNRRGVYVFRYGTSRSDGFGGDGVATATPR